MKHMVIIMILNLLLFLISPVANAFELFGMSFMSNKAFKELMQEQRIGRFAIDIPVEAQLNYREDQFGDTDINIVNWDRTISIDEAFQREWERRISKIETMDKHKKYEAVLVEKRLVNDPAVSIRAVLYHGNSANDKLYWDVLLKKDDALVWLCDSGSQEFQEYVFTELVVLARTYKSNGDELAPSGVPWFHLGKGIVQASFPGEEKTKLSYKNHPLFDDITIEIDTNHFPEKSKSLLSAYSWYYRLIYQLAYGISIHKIRASTRTLAGMNGEEAVVRAKEDDKERTLRFEWVYRGEKSSMERPEIRIVMESKDGDLDKKLALWDQVLNSFHYLGTPGVETKPAPDQEKTQTPAGLTILRKDNKYGLIDAQGVELYRLEYSYIGKFQDGLLIIMKSDGKERWFGLLDCNGKAVTPLKYSSIGLFKDELSIVENHRYKPSEYGGTGPDDIDAVINLSGREITQEKYKHIDPYKNGFAKVRNYKTDTYSFINRRGERISNKWYEWVNDFKEGLAVVKTAEGWGAINEQGREVVSPEYVSVTDFSEERAIVESKQHHYGVVTKEGQLITPMKYDYIDSFIQGVSIVTNNRRRYGLVDHSGKEITPVDFDYKQLDELGLPVFFCRDNLWGAIDELGSTVIPFRYRQLTRFTKNLVKASLGNLYGILDIKGNIVVPFEYQTIKILNNGLLKVERSTDGGRAGFGLVNSSGKILIAPQYEELEEFGPDLILVGLQEKHGLFDFQGNVIVPAIYDSITQFNTGFVKVKKAGHYGLLDLHGREVVPVQYDDQFSLFDNGKWIRVVAEGKYGFYNAGSLAVPLRYDYLFRFDDGHIAFRSSGSWGFINSNGQQIVAPQYDCLHQYRQGLARAKRNGKWGYIDMEGKEVIPFQYNSASDFVADAAYVNESKKWRVITRPLSKPFP